MVVAPSVPFSITQKLVEIEDELKGEKESEKLV
jgi:hypothetical protein